MKLKKFGTRLFMTMDDAEAEKFALGILRVVEHRKALAAIEPAVLRMGELMQRLPVETEDDAISDLNFMIVKGG